MSGLSYGALALLFSAAFGGFLVYVATIKNDPLSATKEFVGAYLGTFLVIAAFFWVPALNIVSAAAILSVYSSALVVAIYVILKRVNERRFTFGVMVVPLCVLAYVVWNLTFPIVEGVGSMTMVNLPDSLVRSGGLFFLLVVYHILVLVVASALMDKKGSINRAGRVKEQL